MRLNSVQGDRNIGRDLFKVEKNARKNDSTEIVKY